MSKRANMGTRSNYMSSPLALFRLRQFGEAVQRLTGETAYLVGSVLHRRTYRDIDVRIMVKDDTFQRIFGADGLWVTNGGLTLANMALSALAREMTGLDVDCQCQHLSDANAVDGDKPRQPLRLPSTMPYVERFET